MKLERWKRALTYISMVIVILSITGCSEQNVPDGDALTITKQENKATDAVQEEAASNETTTEETADENELQAMEETEEEENTIRIGCGSLNSNFNPTTTLESGNASVVWQTQVPLLITDRAGQPILNGIEGETIAYQGTEYTYQGLCDFEIEKEENQTDYLIHIREDVTFSDGVDLTADDVIFSLYLFCDPSYNGNIGLKETEINGLEEYVSNFDVTSITGIQKIDDLTVEITTDGYDPAFLYELILPVCPMHYYGDTELYDYENEQYGFIKGDLSLAKAKASAPMGAGPYKYDKMEGDTVWMTANSEYFLGIPKISQLQLIDVSEAERIMKLGNQEIDLTTVTGSMERFDEILEYNENGALSGERITTETIPASGYGYIGINAGTVNVDGDAFSDASISLRKAFATVLSVYRETAVADYYSQSAFVLQYPSSISSWSIPENAQQNECYGINIIGAEIYSNEMSQKEREAAALKAAKEYLIQAGYTFDSSTGRFTSVPVGAKLRYQVYIQANGEGDHPSYEILTSAKEALESIGILLTIHDISDDRVFWNTISTDEADLWCAAWQATAEPDLSFKYLVSDASENLSVATQLYGIWNEEFANCIQSAWDATDYMIRKQYYQDCYEMLLDWSVEVPIYQRLDAVIYRSDFFTEDYEPSDYTQFWNWEEELYLLEKSQSKSVSE